jgi:hypothetical protein
MCNDSLLILVKSVGKYSFGVTELKKVKEKIDWCIAFSKCISFEAPECLRFILL